MGRDERERRKQAKAEKQRQRQIKAAAIPNPKREPKAVASDPNELRVEWSFDLFDHSKDWRKNESDDHKTFCGVGESLRGYSTRTWKEIMADGKRDHPISQAELCKEARERLEELHLDDYDVLWRFRFTQTERIWGIKDRHVFRVIWWDPDHQVYPTEKRNT